MNYPAGVKFIVVFQESCFAASRSAFIVCTWTGKRWAKLIVACQFYPLRECLEKSFYTACCQIDCCVTILSVTGMPWNHSTQHIYKARNCSLRGSQFRNFISLSFHAWSAIALRNWFIGGTDNMLNWFHSFMWNSFSYKPYSGDASYCAHV